MSRIKSAFENGKAFIPFITCGDPDVETTDAVIREMERNGADLIEIGIPFSDPTAEGPVIQEANIRALAAGITTDGVFDVVRKLRSGADAVKVPFVFMTYANVVFSYGAERFFERCKEVGVDGVILPDVPYEEKEEFAVPARKSGIDFISLIAPTSQDRIGTIAADAEGFVYIVSSLGVTGVRDSITTDIGALAGSIKANTTIPCAVGFGISTPEQAAAAAKHADGAIVGSAIMRLIAANGRKSAPVVGAYVKSMKDALRNL